MTNYLIRRAFQMMLVVLLSTLAIYVMLNIAPGGPLSGLRLGSTDRKSQVSEAEIRRLESYLGLDKPVLLRYVTWLLGDDWMGADWMSLNLRGYEMPDGQHVRFWVDPGPGALKPTYPVWVFGEVDTDGVVHATRVIGKPSGERPPDAREGVVLEVHGDRVLVEQGTQGMREFIVAPETTFEVSGVEGRPADGLWLDVRWLFGAHGLLGDWAGFHGKNRGLLRFDWGTSWKVATGQPVIELIESRLGKTLILMSLTTVLSLVVALPVGIYSAVKQYTRIDYAATTFTFFGSSMPVFWFGLMSILFFSYSFKNWGLPFFPAGGVISPRLPPQGSLLALLSAEPGSLVDRGVHLILPTIVLSLLYMAQWSRFMRSSMLEVLRQDYVRTARAKGLLERIVLARHALRNALIPVITIVGLHLPTLFAGAILTETVFAYPGMGRLYFQALGLNDWPVVMVILVITAILVVMAQLLVDILYTIVDPRIRYT